VTKVFVPVTQLVELPQALIIHPSVAARTTREFIALAKREPGKLTYGSAGIGTAPHMSMELLKSHGRHRRPAHPYRGVSQSVTDILGGRVSGMILNVLTSKPHVDQGAMRALGVTGLKRSEAIACRSDHRRNRGAGLRGAAVGSACWRQPARPRRFWSSYKQNSPRVSACPR